MSERSTPNDSIDAKEIKNDGGSPTSRCSGATSRRGFLQRAAASIAGVATIGSLGETASARNRNRKQLVVAGKGPGRHSYEIQMVRQDGSIYRQNLAEPNDDMESVTDNGDSVERLDGTLWNWNIDNYVYYGEVSHVEADGTLSCHFMDGVFDDEPYIVVHGQDDGKHEYSVATHRGNIDLVPWYTESHDSDHGPSSSEKDGTADRVSGYVYARNQDAYLTHRDPINVISIDDGHIKIDYHIKQ